MVDFISEVQEELRKDDYNRWLKQYGPYLAVIIVLIVGGTGFIQWNNYKTEELANQTSYEFIETVKTVDADKAQAIQNFKTMSETAPEGYAGLALLRAAELELSNGNAEEALAIFDEAATVFSRKRHSQLAQLKAGYIVASQGDYEGVIARMTPLMEKDEPYEYLARELVGFAYKQQGDLQSAKGHFSAIEVDPGAPDSIVKRAEQNLILIEQEEKKEVAEMTAPAETENTPVTTTGDENPDENGSTETETNE